MPMVQEFWKKLNANEKMVMYGAAITIVGAILSLGSQFGSFDLIAAIAVAVIYWLKYSPSKIAWPAPVQTIVLGLAGFGGVVALLGLLLGLSVIFYIGAYGIGLVINAVGAGLMAWFAYKEYQAMPKAPAPPAG